jgi:hypothetical protein
MFNGERVEELETSTKRFLVIGNCEVIQKQVRRQPILKKENIEWQNYFLGKVCHSHEMLLNWKMVVACFVSSSLSS